MKLVLIVLRQRSEINIFSNSFKLIYDSCTVTPLHQRTKKMLNGYLM